MTTLSFPCNAPLPVQPCFFSGFPCPKILKQDTTLSKNNMVAENGRLEKEISMRNHHCLGPCLFFLWCNPTWTTVGDCRTYCLEMLPKSSIIIPAKNATLCFPEESQEGSVTHILRIVDIIDIRYVLIDISYINKILHFLSLICSAAIYSLNHSQSTNFFPTGFKHSNG